MPVAPPYRFLDATAHLGRLAIGFGRHLADFTALVGQILLDALHLLGDRQRWPWREMSANFYKVGVKAMPVTALVQRGAQRLQERLDLIQRQHHQILDLSAPILDIWEGVLAMPLIGSIDHSRASTITERLLQAVVQHRAKLVLIDLTSVEELDQAGADAPRVEVVAGVLSEGKAAAQAEAFLKQPAIVPLAEPSK